MDFRGQPMIIIQINAVIIQIRSFPSFPIFCPYHHVHWHRQLHTILYVSLAPSKKDRTSHQL